MKLVYCGTPEFAVPTLRAVLAAGHSVPLVLTQPDRPAGRKLELQAPPVKRLALEHGLEVMQPERLRWNAELQERLQELQPDAILVVAYGRIIPAWMLNLPRFGNLNLHGSLLPRYRGAAPIQWAVAQGEVETGVTTMRLGAGLDTGPTLLRHVITIGSATTAADLFVSLAKAGADLMLRTLEGLDAGTLPAQPQDDGQATLAPLLTREDGRLLLHQRTAQQAYNRWRGFYPWPGAWDLFRGKRFLVHAMQPAADLPALPPGVLHAYGDRLLVGAAGNTLLELLEVQQEGRPRMTGVALVRAFQLQAGELLG